jgi:single-strand DNA-binding protein
MSSFNRVILMGNLTRDPQLKYLPSNTAVCEFGLAVNHRWRDKDGNQREEVCFVDVSAFGRQGETINQYMTKGRPILIEGRLKYDTWTAQDGTKRSKHNVIVENFTFVGSRTDGGGGGGGGGAERAPAERPPARVPERGPSQSEPSSGYGGGPSESYDAGESRPPSGDDIPF